MSGRKISIASVVNPEILVILGVIVVDWVVVVVVVTVLVEDVVVSETCFKTDTIKNRITSHIQESTIIEVLYMR